MNLQQKLAIYLPFKLEFVGGGDRWIMYSASMEGSILLKNGGVRIPLQEKYLFTKSPSAVAYTACYRAFSFLC